MSNKKARWNQKWYRTEYGYLSHRYRDMRARVNGKFAGDGKSQLWLGLPLLARDEFINWAIDNPDFKRLYREWVESGFQRRHSPSVHRINRDGGYVLENIAFISHAQNSRIALGLESEE